MTIRYDGPAEIMDLIEQWNDEMKSVIRDNVGIQNIKNDLARKIDAYAKGVAVASARPAQSAFEASRSAVEGIANRRGYEVASLPDAEQAIADFASYFDAYGAQQKRDGVRLGLEAGANEAEIDCIAYEADYAEGKKRADRIRALSPDKILGTT